ncbi:MAG: P-loop NTPase [Bacteroidales bacterium]|nr:P-loop NTPase [Bacteroidales bacterium]
METAVISGKGGTGKSSISAAFATLGERVIVADCDVDAANLYLLFNPQHQDEQIYIAGQKAVIDIAKCTNCGICMEYCRFGAISFKGSANIVSIGEISCDGCRLCERVCPEKAIDMVNNDRSRMDSGSFRKGKMVYGRLAPGEENSGKLVNMVRERARVLSKESGIDEIIIDGPPGTGCAVISSITGTDRVIVVTEPTSSGLHDLKRTLEMISKFAFSTWVIINKYDLNESISLNIESYCSGEGVRVAGKIKFDPVVVDAMINSKSVIEYAPGSHVSQSIKEIWREIQRYG